jgi:hypothetical protein
MNDIEQRPRWIRIAKWLLPWAILLIFFILVLAYREPVESLVIAKSAARTTPELWNVPQPLQLDSNLPTTGSTLCYFGYQFQSPWTEITVERKNKAIVALNFSGGQSIGIWDESKTLDDRTAGKPEDQKRDQLAKALFGYTFRSRVLNATPADLHWFSSSKQMARSSSLIVMKDLDARYLKGGVYSFQTPWFRGFQFGRPAQDELVSIEFYDPENIKIKLIISSRQGAASKPSQSDLNQIISTLQPVPPAR